MNACRNYWCYALQVSLLMSLKALFDERLQEFIGFDALQVSLLMSLKAFLNECLQGFIGSYALLGLTSDVLKGLFFNECLQDFICFCTI